MILAQFDPDTHAPLSASSAPWMTLANNPMGNPPQRVTGCSIVPLPAGMPAPPDGKTHVVHAWSKISGVNCQIRMAHPMTQEKLLTTGWFVRFLFLIPTATLQATAKTPHAQTKIALFRVATDPKGFVTLGQGNDFNSDDNSFASRIDYQTLPIKTGPPIVGNVWHEAIVEMRRDPIQHLGSATIRYDGKFQGARTHSMLGTDDPKQPRDVEVGLVWTQGVGGLTETYVSSIEVSDAPIQSLMQA